MTGPSRHTRQTQPSEQVVRSNRKTDVTVIIPTFNRARLLRGSVRSVLNQSHESISLIVSDNASTDATSELLREFDDERMTVVARAENVGMNKNFQLSLDMVDSEFVAFLPDDDLMYERFLETCVDVLKNNDAVAVVHTAFDVIDGDGSVVQHNVRLCEADTGAMVVETGAQFLRRSMASDWLIGFSTAVIRTQALKDMGGFREEDLPNEDIGIWLRQSVIGDIAFVPDTLGAIRFHAATSTASMMEFRDGGYRLGDGPFVDNLLSIRRRFLTEFKSRVPNSDALSRTATAHARRSKVEALALSRSEAGRWQVAGRLLAGGLREDRGLLVERRWWIVLGTTLVGARLTSAVKALRRAR